MADNHDRARILVISELLSGLIVSGLAVFLLRTSSGLTVRLALCSVFALNALRTVGLPAQMSVEPDLLEKDTYMAAGGLLSTSKTIIALAGSALAGLVISAIGSPGALAIDALSFGVASWCVVAARLPKRNMTEASTRKWESPFSDIREAWGVIASHPVLRTLVFLGHVVA